MRHVCVSNDARFDEHIDGSLHWNRGQEVSIELLVRRGTIRRYETNNNRNMLLSNIVLISTPSLSLSDWLTRALSLSPASIKTNDYRR